MAYRAVLYHAHCPDGLGAALAVRLSPLSTYGTTEYHAVNYSEPPPDLGETTNVYVLDFSYPAEVLDAWDREGRNVVVIDHHATSMHIVGRLNCVHDQSKSGAVLAWEFFHPDEPVPLFYRYIQDRDLWRWEIPGSREFSAGLAARPRGLDAMQEVFCASERDGCATLIAEGRVILAYQAQVIESHVKRAQIDSERFAVPVPVVNATTLASEIGNELLSAYPEAPFAAIYQDVSGKRLWSLRSEAARRDVSVIAKGFGGGGHRNAAGFSEVLA